MQIPDKVGSKYRFIVLAGQRVAQLQKGAKPRVYSRVKIKMTQMAIKELATGKIEFTRKSVDEGGLVYGETSDI